MYIRSGRGKNKARNAEHCGRDARAIMNLTLQIYKNFLFVLHNLLIFRKLHKCHPKGFAALVAEEWLSVCQL